MTVLKHKIIEVIIIVVVLFSVCSCSAKNDYEESYYNSSGTTVYITKTGDKYHRSSCTYLSQSKIEIDLGEAKDGGYGRCSKCKPPIE